MARTHSLPVVSELAASVASVECEVGDTVSAGAILVLLESMKMEIPVLAQRDGTVTSIEVSARDVVQEGDVLVVLD